MATNSKSKTAKSESTVWPGAFGVYSQSKEAVLRNVTPLLITWVAVALVSGVSEGLFHNAGSFIGFIFSSLLAATYVITYLASVRGKKVDFEEALRDSVPFWLNMVVMNVLICVALVVSLILLIVPFFFVFPRLALANYFLVDKDLDAVDAIRASWEETRGHSLKVWGLVGAGFVMCLPIFTIIGIPVTIYLLFMYSASSALLYEFITKHS